MFIRLEAVAPQLGIFRFYELAIERDLFDLQVLRIRNGRIGRPGQSRVVATGSEADLMKEVSRRLKRRSTAPKRIGAEYKVVWKD
jgi:predicted DNA-binding WGR domain protein